MAGRRLFVLALLAVVVLAAGALAQTEDHVISKRATGVWLSGAAGPGAEGPLYTWRGEPGAIAGVFHDYDASSQTGQWGLDGQLANWARHVDNALGALFPGESWAAAATGAYDARWRQALQTIYSKWLKKSTIYLRFAHRLNSASAWQVNSGNVAAFKTVWARFYNLVHEELVLKGKSAKVVFSLNDWSETLPAAQLWPGNQYVDVVAVCVYDRGLTVANWNKTFYAKDQFGGPLGLDQWRLFAAAHGKPLAVSEWGTKTNNAFFIQKMNAWFRLHAGSAAGQLLYEVYQNNGWAGTQLYPTTAQANAANAYKALVWGSALTPAPTTKAPTTKPSTSKPGTTTKPATTHPLTTRPLMTTKAPTPAPTTTKPASSGYLWLSGASGDGVANGGWASWRGEPVPIATTWNSDVLEWHLAQQTLDHEYNSWTGDLDNSVGAIYEDSGETWETAATGAYDARWRQVLQTINSKWLSKKTLYLRFAHEFNGNWYPWSVRSASAAAGFRTAWCRFYNLVQQELVAKGRKAKLTWGPNFDSKYMSAEALWPGSQCVDVVGVDFYDWWPVHTAANWDSESMARDGWGGPRGIEAWRQFALSKGKPFALPEWGLATFDSPTDNPYFIQKMNDYFRVHAGSGPGQILYECYFSVFAVTSLYPSTQVPSSANLYKSLVWGLPAVARAEQPAASSGSASHSDILVAVVVVAAVLAAAALAGAVLFIVVRKRKAQTGASDYALSQGP